MAKVALPLPLKSFLLLCSRRSYAVAAAETKAVQAASSSAVRKAMDSSSSTAANSKSEKQKEGFWMRDPKTGNWIPESHFDDDIDVVALREKFLPGRHPF